MTVVYMQAKNGEYPPGDAGQRRKEGNAGRMEKNRRMAE